MTDPVKELLKLARARFTKLEKYEKELVRAAASGVPADFRGERGDKPMIRAKVLAWLAADPAATVHVHHKGVQLVDANIEGALDLEHADLPRPLVLAECAVEQGINLRHAHTRAVHLLGTETGPIWADGLRVEGNLFLRAYQHQNGSRTPFHARGQVRLTGADIGSSLDCSRGHFDNPSGDALSADGVHVEGGVFLQSGFTAQGTVRFVGAEIGGSLACDGGKFEKQDGYALVADGARVRGDIFLRKPFVAKGEVRLLGAEVGGNLECAGGRFENPKSVKNPDPIALNLRGAEVAGILILQGLSEKPSGQVDLSRAAVGELADDEKSWPEAGNLVLDGFTYDHLERNAPHTADKRLEWLKLQPRAKYSVQPYEHLAKVLRSMGLEHHVRRVAIAKQQTLRA